MNHNLIEGGVIPSRIFLGRHVTPMLFGDAPGYPGYYQVNFQVPSDNDGSAVPWC
jgi:uncharacterized protein (TIGR03437 family)